MEFLADMMTHVPEGTPQADVDATKAREAVHSGELAAQGSLLRLWKPPVKPGEWRTLGLWRADDEEQLQEILATMPLHKWMTVEVTPLTPHPSDPGTSKSYPEDRGA
jgi:muconolactone D-isomerase